MTSPIESRQCLAHQCRVCGVTLSVRVAANYHELGQDPMNLLRFVVCNRCADLHDRERRISESILNSCFSLIRQPTVQQQTCLRQLLNVTTRKYAEVIADILKADQVVWDDAFPQLLFDHPSQCPKILHKYRQDCAKGRRRRFTPATVADTSVETEAVPALPSLPYADP